MKTVTIAELKAEKNRYEKYLEKANRNCSWAKCAEKRIALLQQIIGKLEGGVK